MPFRYARDFLSRLHLLIRLPPNCLTPSKLTVRQKRIHRLKLRRALPTSRRRPAQPRRAPFFFDQSPLLDSAARTRYP